MSEVVEIFEVCRDGEGRLACLELRKKRFRDQSRKVGSSNAVKTQT